MSVEHGSPQPSRDLEAVFSAAFDSYPTPERSSALWAALRARRDDGSRLHQLDIESDLPWPTDPLCREVAVHLDVVGTVHLDLASAQPIRLISWRGTVATRPSLKDFAMSALKSAPLRGALTLLGEALHRMRLSVPLAGGEVITQAYRLEKIAESLGSPLPGLTQIKSRACDEVERVLDTLPTPVLRGLTGLAPEVASWSLGAATQPADDRLRWARLLSRIPVPWDQPEADPTFDSAVFGLRSYSEAQSMVVRGSDPRAVSHRVLISPDVALSGILSPVGVPATNDGALTMAVSPVASAVSASGGAAAHWLARTGLLLCPSTVITSNGLPALELVSMQGGAITGRRPFTLGDGYFQGRLNAGYTNLVVFADCDIPGPEECADWGDRLTAIGEYGAATHAYLCATAASDLLMLGDRRDTSSALMTAYCLAKAALSATRLDPGGRNQGIAHDWIHTAINLAPSVTNAATSAPLILPSPIVAELKGVRLQLAASIQRKIRAGASDALEDVEGLQALDQLIALRPPFE